GSRRPQRWLEARRGRLDQRRSAAVPDQAHPREARAGARRRGERHARARRERRCARRRNAFLKEAEMSHIEFAEDYGYPPAAPFWLVFAEEGRRIERVCQTEPTREAAEAAAARLALAFPVHEFHVCCVMATVQTSP